MGSNLGGTAISKVKPRKSLEDENTYAAEAAAGRCHAGQCGAEAPVGKEVVAPAAKRSSVAHLMDAHEMSERRGVKPSAVLMTIRYHTSRADHVTLGQCIPTAYAHGLLGLQISRLAGLLAHSTRSSRVREPAVGDRFVGPANELLAHVLDHLPLARNYLQHLRVLADACGICCRRSMAGPWYRVDNALPWQMLRQRPARRLAALNDAVVVFSATAICAAVSASVVFSSRSATCSSNWSNSTSRSEDCPNCSCRSFLIVSLSSKVTVWDSASAPGRSLGAQHRLQHCHIVAAPNQRNNIRPRSPNYWWFIDQNPSDQPAPAVLRHPPVNASNPEPGAHCARLFNSPYPRPAGARSALGRIAIPRTTDSVHESADIEALEDLVTVAEASESACLSSRLGTSGARCLPHSGERPSAISRQCSGK